MTLLTWRHLIALVAIEDPFCTHFDVPDETQLAKKVKNIKATNFKTVKVAVPSWLSCSLTVPDGLEVDADVFKTPPNSTQDFQVR